MSMDQQTSLTAVVS
uniref:Uncharacterized protein n=1 Tax=Arundo donax TaxID=35708 RepID=A0A0A9BVE4_ARUDO